MTTVVIGKTGQLASELRSLNENLIFLGQDDFNIYDIKSVLETLARLEANAIINAAAYTAVDKAESELERAQALNTTAVEYLCEYCEQNQAHLVHVSTDYVFSGTKGIPYLVDDKIAPSSVYGKTKAAAEALIKARCVDNSTIIRTSWVYSKFGNNFVKTMLKLMSEKPELRVIDDQIGTPTCANGLAQACLEASNSKLKGTYHWTDEGVASWYDFALAIQALAFQNGMLDKMIPVYPIPTSEYPTPATRPHYSVLDKSRTRVTFSTKTQHWRSSLAQMLDSLTS